MAVIAAAVYLRPLSGAGQNPSAPSPPASAPAVVREPLGPAAPPRAFAGRETDERARVFMSQGTAAVERGAFSEAATLLKQAAELAPSDPDAWNLLGVALVSLGDLGAGVEAFRRAARLKPTHADARRNLGVALDRQGKFAEAATQYRAFLTLATERDPVRNDVRRRLGEIASRKAGE